MNAKGEKLFEVELDSGDVVIVQRLSPFARIALMERAEELYPLPDPTPYQQPVGNTPAGVTVLTPPEDNADYLRLVTDVKQRRVNLIYEGIITASVVDIVGGREAAIARYAEQLHALRLRLPMNDRYTDWQAVVLFCILRVRTDTDRIVAVAGDSFPLEEEEIRDGIRCFRRPLQSHAAAGHPRPQSSSGAAAAAG